LTQQKLNPIWIRATISLISYKYYDRSTDSFNVSDYCDTIWTGSQYLPVTAGGNRVNIQRGAQIYGGEGITVADIDGQPSDVVITNAGMIIGRSKTHDGTLRDSSVYFTNTGGTLNNSGLIVGDNVGVLGNESCARAITINNTGTISGSQYAIHTGGGGDLINTSGAIEGNILTGPGNDTINVTGGTIHGSIDGGTGDNTLNFNLPGDVTFVYGNNVLRMSNTFVLGGVLKLDGSAAGNLWVAPGATLGGNAAITGSLDNYGTVSPGNSVGTIGVGGNYTQQRNSRLVVEVTKSSSGFTGDQLIVGGAAALAADSTIDVRYAGQSSRVFRTGDAFNVIATGSWVSDRGAAVSCDSPFLDITGGARGPNYVLSLRNVATFQSVAQSGNNRAVAKALDGDAAMAAGGYADMLNRFLFSDAAAFNNDLTQLSPAAYLSVSAASNRTTQYMAESLGNYLRGRRAGQINVCPSSLAMQSLSPEYAALADNSLGLTGLVHYTMSERDELRQQQADPSRSVWFNPFGVFYGEQSAGDHLGFQSNVVGEQFGIDKQVGDHCILGIGAACDLMHTNTVDFRSADTTNTFRVGPYATLFSDTAFLDFSVTGGFHHNDMGRLATINDTDYKAQTVYCASDLSLYLDVGRNYSYGPYTFAPLVSLQYIYYRQNPFTESGADVADLVVSPMDAHSLRSRVGAQLARTCLWGNTKIIPDVFAGWAHEYLENDPLEARLIGGITPFSIDRGGVFRDAGYFGAGLTVAPCNHVSLFAQYNGEYSSGSHFTAIDLGLVVAF
jgi:uncharacterized protein with beta-barrel porin domain